MNIKYKPLENTIPFKELKLGAVFRFALDGSPFMKIKADDDKYNIVNLITCKADKTEMLDSHVIPVNCELTLDW